MSFLVLLASAALAGVGQTQQTVDLSGWATSADASSRLESFDAGAPKAFGKISDDLATAIWPRAVHMRKIMA